MRPAETWRLQFPDFFYLPIGHCSCSPLGVSRPKRFVYILKSISFPDEYYVGVTSDMAGRIAAHNEGMTASTVDHRPWPTLVVIEFDEERPAIAFERYLKTGSGREFARRHFRQTVKR